MERRKEGRKDKWMEGKKQQSPNRLLLESVMFLPLEVGTLLSLGSGTMLLVLTIAALCALESFSLAM